MSTPEQIAERAEVDRFIANWMAEQVTKFDQEVARDEGMAERAEARGEPMPAAAMEHLNEIEFGEHMRHRFPVGVFLDNTDYDDTGAWKPSTKKLMQVFETGREMVNAALSHPDATEEFLEEARGLWGPVTDEALDYLSTADDIPRRDPVTNEWV